MDKIEISLNELALLLNSTKLLTVQDCINVLEKKDKESVLESLDTVNRILKVSRSILLAPITDSDLDRFEPFYVAAVERVSELNQEILATLDRNQNVHDAVEELYKNLYEPFQS